MTFVNDEGEILDFDGDFAITKQAVSFFNSKIKGDFSVNFNVDNNSVNRKVLGYDGPQMLNQVAYTRQSFTLMRNGNPFIRGSIVIQNDLGPTLSCFFISGNSNWINLLMGLITELDYTGVTNVTDYTTQLTYAEVSALAGATGGVCFPLVDWIWRGNKGSNYWLMSFIQDIKNDPEFSVFDFYPCFYLHTLVGEIAKQSGLKIDGNILDDPLYNTLVLTPKSGELKRDRINVTTASGSAFSTAAGPVKITGFTETSDPENCFASNSYTANRSSRLVLTITVLDASSGTPGCNGQIFVRKNGVNFTTFTVQGDGTGEGVYRIWNDVLTGTILTVVPGDVIDLTLNRIGAAGTISVTSNLKFEIPTKLTVADYVTPSQFLPPIASLDIIKFIVSYFGCSVYFNEYSKTISINVIEKIKPEDSVDWSEYYQSHSSNYTTAQSKNNYIRLLEPEETSLRGYNNSHKLKYGEANLETQNTLKEDNDMVSVPFAPSAFGLETAGSWMSNAQLVNLVDQEPILYTSITNSAGLARFNYPTLESYVKGSQAVRIVDDDRGDIGYFVCVGGTVTDSVYLGLPFTGDGTGKIYPQAIEYLETNPRLLVVANEVLTSSFSLGEIRYGDADSPVTGVTYLTASHKYGYFTKSATGLNIDQLKANAAPDNPDIATFTNPSVKNLYYRKINRLIGNPAVLTKMLIPEAVFQSFQFDRFIYLKTADLTGYFWVDNIGNYRDGNTKVDVSLMMV